MQNAPKSPEDVSLGDQRPPTSEQEGLQLGLKRNLFQGGAALVFALAGGLIGSMLTDDRADLAAMAGGLIGAVIGTFVSGLVLLLFDYPAWKNPLRIPDIPMTGFEHLHYQKRRAIRLTQFGLLLFVPAAIYCLATDPQRLSLLGTFSLGLVLVIAVLIPPKCPFCRRLLAVSWKGWSPGEYCRRCGSPFSSGCGRAPLP